MQRIFAGERSRSEEVAAMTFDEVLETGKEKLLEYEPRLKGKVRGIRPYDRLKAKRVSERYEGSLSTARKEVIEQLVGSVLDKLIALTDGFWMSEPEDHLPVE